MTIIKLLLPAAFGSPASMVSMNADALLYAASAAAYSAHRLQAPEQFEPAWYQIHFAAVLCCLGSRLSHLFGAHQVTADLIQLGKIRLRIGQKANEPAARGQTNGLPQFRFPAIVLPGPDRDGRCGDEALAFFDEFLATPRLGEHFVGNRSRFLPLAELLVRKHSTLVNQELIADFRVSISRLERLIKVRKRVARIFSQHERRANCSEITDLATDI